MKTRYIIAIAAGALMLCGCQRESLVADSGAQYDGKVKFAPGVAGIGSANGGVRSGLSDGSASAGSESLTLRSADGRFTIPMSLTVTGAQAADVTSGAPTKSTLINENGGITADEFADAISDTFMVAAWNIPDVGDPIQCIPDADAKAFTGYVSGDEDNGFYQKVMYRTKDAEGEDLATPYWMTVQPGSAAPADDEYKWKKNEAEKTFYAYANVPAGDTVSLLAEGAGQTLTCSGVPTQDILMGYYSGPGTTGGKNTGTAGIQFRHPLAAVKFKTGTLASGVTISSVAIENVYGNGDLMVEQLDSLFTWKRKDGDAFKDANLLSEVSAACDGDAVLVIPQSFPPKARIRVTIEQDGEPEPFNVYTALTGSWAAGMLYTYTIEYNPLPEELLPGKFSVSATDYIQFSKGNLFCTRSGSESSYTYKFGFESHQYDCRSRYGYDGDKAMIDGSEKETPVNTSGLFQWNCVNGVISPDYGAFTTNADLTGKANDKLEFGESIDDPFDWITLSSSDWQYIFKERQNSANLYKLKVEVCGMNGLILAPDDYSGAILDKYSSETTPTWAEAEAAGLVFLPYAGIWERTAATSPIGYWGTGLRYWAVDGSSSTAANRLRFESKNGTDSNIDLGGAGRKNGLSVRLVQRFKKSVEYVEIAAKYDGDKVSTLKWAKTNVGATASDPYGWYFSYANVTGYLYDSGWKEANNPTKSLSGWTKDTYKSTPGYNVTGSIPVGAETDAARANLGGTWRLPTQMEFQALCKSCYIEWVDDYNGTGVPGVIVYEYDSSKGGKGVCVIHSKYWTIGEDGENYSSGTSSDKPTGVYSTATDAHIFFPAAGIGLDTTRDGLNKAVRYWVSTGTTEGSSAPTILFRYIKDSRSNDDVNIKNPIYRYRGMSIRAVSE